MSAGTPLLEQLIEALRCLPGVGQKSAQRMAYQLLERNREGGARLAQALAAAMEKVGHCEQCRDFSEQSLCATCASASRERSQLCAVENPADRMVIEQATGYRGLYFVLQGRLSPLDGIGPQEIGIGAFEKLLSDGEVREVILATNPTVEGEATAHFLAEVTTRFGLRASRIAHGVPVGGELEYVDGGTLAHALAGRQAL